MAPVAVKTENPYPYVTQHCANGGHENSKLLSFKGTLMPSCKGTYTYRFLTVTCTCWCHAMFAEMGIVAPAVSTPTPTTPTAGTPGAVDPVPFDVLVGGLLPPMADEHKAYRILLLSGNVSPQLANFVRKHVLGVEPSDQQKKDASERRKRGELEANVEVVCRLWLDGKLPYELLVTSDIATMIDILDPPSQGAIDAVLKRWADAGYCMRGEKPIRFMGFTPEVLERGITVVKAANSREKKHRAQGFF